MTQSKPNTPSFGDLFTSCFGPSNMGLSRTRPSGKKRQLKKNQKKSSTRAWQAVGQIKVYGSTAEMIADGVFSR